MALTAEQKAFVDWQLAQVDPLTGRRIGDIVAEKGLDPYRDEVAAMADNAYLQAQNQLAAGGQVDTVAPWMNPNWREVQSAAEEAEYQRRANLDAEWQAIQRATGNAPVLGPSNDPNLGNVSRGPAPYNPGANQPPMPGADPLVPPGGSGGSGGAIVGSGVVDGGVTFAGGNASGLGNSGVVYGPDGRTYSSAAAALAAGVTNYSYSKPMFGPTNSGFTGGGQPGSMTPTNPYNVNQPGLIAGASQQLFNLPTGAQMPRGVPNPFGP